MTTLKAFFLMVDGVHLCGVRCTAPQACLKQSETQRQSEGWRTADSSLSADRLHI